MPIPRLFAAFGLMLVSGIGHALGSAAVNFMSEGRSWTVTAKSTAFLSRACSESMKSSTATRRSACGRFALAAWNIGSIARQNGLLSVREVGPNCLSTRTSSSSGFGAEAPVRQSMSRSKNQIPLLGAMSTETLRSIRKQCPLALSDRCHFPAFLYPFLDGGADKFFSATTRVLDESDPKDRAVISGSPSCYPVHSEWHGTEARSSKTPGLYRVPRRLFEMDVRF